MDRLLIPRMPRLQVLGPVRAWHAGQEIPLGPPQRKAVLGMLLVKAGRTLSTDQIIEQVWGERPPAKPLAAVQAHISVLRKILDPDRVPWEPSRLISSVRGGYLLDPEGVDADVVRFRRYLAEAAACRSQNRHQDAVPALRHALALWRGDPLAGACDSVVRAYGDRLELSRVA